MKTPHTQGQRRRRCLPRLVGSIEPVPPVRSCPECHRTFGTGEYEYTCEVCGGECCTACSDTTTRHAVVCDKGWATPARAMLVIECHGGRHGPREIATYPETLIPANHRTSADAPERALNL